MGARSHESASSQAPFRNLPIHAPVFPGKLRPLPPRTLPEKLLWHAHRPISSDSALVRQTVHNTPLQSFRGQFRGPSWA
eukprot:13228721-Alexandrium_andersonii.AAC.1